MRNAIADDIIYLFNKRPDTGSQHSYNNRKHGNRHSLFHFDSFQFRAASMRRTS